MLIALLLALSAPDVDDIVSRHIAARGGYERIKAIRTLVYSGGRYRERDYTGDGKAFMALMRPYYKVVSNPEDPASRFREGWDGSAWEWYGDPGFVVRTVGAASAALRHGVDMEGPFVDYREKGTTITLAPPTEIAGRPVYRLVVTVRDGFVRDYFIDQASFLVVAERQSAPVHAFGESVRSETRVGDYRAVAGVLFPHSFAETELATGTILSEMQWGSIEANRDLPERWFSPPLFTRTRLQQMLEQLFAERADVHAVMWTYRDFRRAHGDVDTSSGVEAIGFQVLKMGEHASAIALLEANAADYPSSANAAFALGRAYRTAGNVKKAREEFERALKLDPNHKRAKEAMKASTP